MARITLSIPDSFLTKLQSQAEQYQVSLAQYARTLLEAGFSQATKNSSENVATNATALWKNNLTWSLECRYLLRYLVDHVLKDNPEKHATVLDLIKEKANTIVEGILADNLR